MAAGACHSFDPSTHVLMADGSTKPIKDVKLGDEVAATDPETGETTWEPVTRLHVNQDTDLTDVTVENEATGTRAVLRTTSKHPFWVADRGEWVDAADLQPGTQLLGAEAAATPRVVAVSVVPRTGEMRDLTVEKIHTYYVVAESTSVLVHNCGVGGTAASPPVLLIDSLRVPNIARNVQDALNAGHPSVLNRTTNPLKIKANRSAACAGFCGPGSTDEYPFASTVQGGVGARVRGVPLAEQRVQGGILSRFYKLNNIGPGDPFEVKVIK
ncbi:polymorphic toxin-type HINT domain-containing protein [Cryobacterium psychrophilum]|nr:polymorphic toxin-type HINT domain-containing protein [Cryobacterium psychrophilum]